jgi:DHA1 family bicyclomycin/chloramphenicol resistance-like MFS transporter
MDACLPPRQVPSVTRRLLPSVLLLLTVFGPISMDLYLPALPASIEEPTPVA